MKKEKRDVLTSVILQEMVRTLRAREQARVKRWGKIVDFLFFSNGRILARRKKGKTVRWERWHK